MRTFASRRFIVHLTILLTLMASMPFAYSKEMKTKKVKGGKSDEERISQMKKVHKNASMKLPNGLRNVQPLEFDVTPEEQEELKKSKVGEPKKIGVVKKIKGNVGKPLKSKKFEGGISGSKDEVWAVKVKSTTRETRSMRVKLGNVSLGENMQITFLGNNGQSDGPYTDINGDVLHSRTMNGNEIIVMAESIDGNAIDEEATFNVVEVGIIGSSSSSRRNLRRLNSFPCSEFDFLGCMEDASCYEDDEPVTTLGKAVASLEWQQGPYVYSCSGGLIANAENKPYMMTANHCITKDNDSFETWFNYKTSGCGGSCTSSEQIPSNTKGMTVKATGRNGDYTLLELNIDGNSELPADAVFLGWNNDDVARNDNLVLYRVSYPGGGPQVYSEHTVRGRYSGCSGFTPSNYIFSRITLGMTDGGSSGAPLVMYDSINSKVEFVGQLYGGCGWGSDYCTQPGTEIDGSLAGYFPAVESYLTGGSGGGGDDGDGGSGSCAGKKDSCSSDSDCCNGLRCHWKRNICI